MSFIPPSLALIAGPSDFRGPDFGYTAVGGGLPPGVESGVVDRDVGGFGFSAFRLSPVGGTVARWSYSLPRRPKRPGLYSVTVSLEWSDDPAPSFAGALSVGLADQPNDLSSVAFSPAEDVQVTAVGNGDGPLLSVLEWTLPNPAGKTLIACALTQPGGGGPIVYLYEATLRFVGGT